MYESVFAFSAKNFVAFYRSSADVPASSIFALSAKLSAKYPEFQSQQYPFHTQARIMIRMRIKRRSVIIFGLLKDSIANINLKMKITALMMAIAIKISNIETGIFEKVFPRKRSAGRENLF